MCSNYAPQVWIPLHRTEDYVYLCAFPDDDGRLTIDGTATGKYTVFDAHVHATTYR